MPVARARPPSSLDAHAMYWSRSMLLPILERRKPSNHLSSVSSLYSSPEMRCSLWIPAATSATELLPCCLISLMHSVNSFSPPSGPRRTNLNDSYQLANKRCISTSSGTSFQSRKFSINRTRSAKRFGTSCWMNFAARRGSRQSSTSRKLTGRIGMEAKYSISACSNSCKRARGNVTNASASLEVDSVSLAEPTSVDAPRVVCSPRRLRPKAGLFRRPTARRHASKRLNETQAFAGRHARAAKWKDIQSTSLGLAQFRRTARETRE
mmetsp:Transcript_69012/g.192139  ORF Transcript_69012/g.192139 Transcript_69012/m.192139 type:complete len:266 (+) Transcript_69012:643-1440(+)